MILDTDALSAFIDGNSAIGARLASGNPPSLPVIVIGEFRYGIAASRYRTAYEAWLTEHLPAFDILPVTEVTTRAYAQIRTSLKKIGRPVPANDAWIAALAVQHRLPILSRDVHFDHIPGIQREEW